MYKARLQKHFNTRNIPRKLQSRNKRVNCTQHVLSNQVSTAHCVTRPSLWLCSFLCRSKLFYIMLLVCCKFSEPATYFIRQWFCKFLSVLSPPNNQEQQTSVIEVFKDQGHCEGSCCLLQNSWLQENDWELSASCFLTLSCGIRTFEGTNRL